MNYHCKICGMDFDYPRVEVSNSRIKNMWLMILFGFLTCGIGWLFLPICVIKVPDTKKCPHCLRKITPYTATLNNVVKMDTRSETDKKKGGV